ncbi:hypothetical protein Tco_0958849 [Tanacetum coccineum]
MEKFERIALNGVNHDISHLESDTREDAPQWIRDLRPSSSQLKIPIYPEVRAPEDPWAVKEEVPLEDAIAANISRAEKIKKCRVVCGTHGIGSAHHAMSDGIHVSVPIVVPRPKGREEVLLSILFSLAQAGLDSFTQAPVCSFHEPIRLRMFH